MDIMENAVDVHVTEACEANEASEVRRSSRQRKLPQSKFSDMQVTYPVVRTSHTKPAIPTAKVTNKGNLIRRKKRSSKSDLWLHRPKNTKTTSEVLYNATELGPKDDTPVQIKDLSTIPVLSEEEVTCADSVISNEAAMSEEPLLYENVVSVEPQNLMYSMKTFHNLNHEEVIESNLSNLSAEVVELIVSDQSSADVNVDPVATEVILSDDCPDSTDVQERHLAEAANTEDSVTDANTLFQIQMQDGNVVILQGVQVIGEEATQLIADQSEEAKNNIAVMQDSERAYNVQEQPHLNMTKPRKAGNFICDECNYKCSSSSNLRRHKLTHSSVKMFKCSQCAKSFRQKAHLDRHIRSLHATGAIKCPVCAFVCEGTPLSVHMTEKHGAKEIRDEKSVEQVFCEECNFGPASKKVISQHMKLHRDGTEMKFFCEQCSFITHNKSRFERHLLVHSGEKPFACDQCDYQSAQKAHVLRHMSSKHRVVVSPQRKCKKRQPTADAKKPAVGTVGPKHFLCNFCTMTFTKLINLRKHVMIQHAGLYTPDQPGQYSCVMCTYVTGHWNNLLVHMRKHSFQTVKAGGNLAFTCVLCPFSCSSRILLHQHMHSKHQVTVESQDASPAEDSSPGVKVQLAPGTQYSTAHIESPPQVKVDCSTGGNYVELNGDIYLLQTSEENGEAK